MGRFNITPNVSPLNLLWIGASIIGLAMGTVWADGLVVVYVLSEMANGRVDDELMNAVRNFLGP